jgi:hypothetical protein
MSERINSWFQMWFALAIGQGKGRHLAFKMLNR